MEGGGGSRSSSPPFLKISPGDYLLTGTTRVKARGKSRGWMVGGGAEPHDWMGLQGPGCNTPLHTSVVVGAILEKISMGPCSLFVQVGDTETQIKKWHPPPLLFPKPPWSRAAPGRGDETRRGRGALGELQREGGGGVEQPATGGLGNRGVRGATSGAHRSSPLKWARGPLAPNPPPTGKGLGLIGHASL